MGMIRMQVQLTEEEVRRLRERAQSEGISRAEVIRRALAEHLQAPPSRDQEQVRRVLSLAGIVKDGPCDLSTRHDSYLAEALAEEMDHNRAGAKRAASGG